MKELIGILNNPLAPAQTADEQYDVMLDLAGKGYTLLIVGRNIDPNDELLQKLELSGMFKAQFELRPFDRVKYSRVKGSFLSGAQGQGPRDKWGKAK
jgi:phosphoglycolate phosphatase-like HAD superfamily hydrolase